MADSYNAYVEAAGKEIFNDLVGKFLMKRITPDFTEFYWVSYIRGEYIGAVEIAVIDSGDNHSLSVSISDNAIRLPNLKNFEVVSLEKVKKEALFLLHSDIFAFMKEIIK